MKKEGFIIIQHGDFPFDFTDKHRGMFSFVEEMINEVTRTTREIKREPDDCYIADMRKIVGCFQRIGGYQHLELGYMQFLTPTVEEAAQKLEEQGVKRIIFVTAPGIMMRSSHSLIDVPRILGKIKHKHPDLQMMYTPPGVDFDKMADVFIKRMDYALGKHLKRKKLSSGTFSSDWGVVLIAHGDVPLDYLQTDKMEMAGQHIDKWSNMVRNWPRNEENDPLYYDSLELENHVKERVGYEIEMANLEFSSPTLQEALDTLIARGVKKVYFMGGTGFMDRSSHTLVDIPEAVEKLKESNFDVEIHYVCPNIDLVCDDLSVMLVEKVNQAIVDGNYL